MPLRFVSEALLTTFFPAPCRLCGVGLTNFSRLPVCQPCLDSIMPAVGAMCEICGERLAGEFLPPRCEMCRRHRLPFRKAVACAAYDGEVRALLHLFKYQGVKSAAHPLGKLLAIAIAKLGRELADGGEAPILVAPVPLHGAKQRARGFNQSELITRSALRQLRQIWDGPPLLYSPRLLMRVRRTEAQMGLSRHQRRSNLRNAFRLRRPEGAGRRRVLLVDDILTTGSTLAECARTLNRAGAEGVWAATIARAFRFSAAELNRWHFNGLEQAASIQHLME
ncbi:MAG: ComF family protein [Acidobacteriaceae bacterium]